MNSELYKFLMQYGELDDTFIYDIYELIMRDEPQLRPFIEDFKVYDDPKDERYGVYSKEAKKIGINKERILTSDDVVKNKKVLALEVVRHEIEHARHIEKIWQLRNDIESLLIRLSYRDYVLEHGIEARRPDDKIDYESLYTRFKKSENYDLDPAERLARIDAWRYVINLLKNQRRTKDLLDARSSLYFAYVRGYEDNGCYLNPPTFEYLLNMGMYQDYYFLKKRVEREQYIFETRLRYGLPLQDGKEYDAKILQKVRLQKSKRSV